MPRHQHSARFPLPKAWPARVRAALLHVIALAQYAAVYTRRMGNVILNSARSILGDQPSGATAVGCQSRLGGLLKHYHRAAA